MWALTHHSHSGKRANRFQAALHRYIVEQLAKRTTALMGALGSTPLPPTRIIAAESIKTGPRVGPVREPGFNDAWRLTETYVSRSVGVLA